ncbi:putative RNA-binding protein [Psilocybe cubensis]|uniref:RRM domain-containing protein n=2 Tax=Psilocybe cubensis TaxID=181762 RepID=A0A8H7Y767_PSICU|nr:putative RNA-binding protein [Psilocybe cubensis]KAH9486555.1 putative RNA-binding protein [Psilocybe cubensis]
MNSTQKLTKKQKKGLAFRERKTGKGQTKNAVVDDMETNAIPLMEDQDLAGSDSYPSEIPGGDDETKGKTTNVQNRVEGEPKEGKVGAKGKGKGKGKAETETSIVAVEKMKGQPKKRKRSDEDEAEKDGDENLQDGVKKKSKRKKVDGDKVIGGKADKPTKQRFILFLGNLKYTTTEEAIKAHFAVCDPPPTIRLLTPKQTTPVSSQRPKSKGCAFLEFSHRNALQQGLKLHQSMLDGRMINVELTAGGGGKGESRLMKVRERNKALLGQREERIEKEAKQDNSFPNLPSKPQRFSATSGLEQRPTSRKTWTVGDIDDGITHRGGTRHRKKSKAPSKTWGTGVNAIPVG